MNKCIADGCTRETNDTSNKRLKLGYCDAHYQRLYFNKDVKSDTPIKKYSKRGEHRAFLDKAQIANVGICIVWPFGKDSRGYGQTYYNGKRTKAHRASLMIKDNLDQVPSDVFACHKCDNRLCVNPNHIYWGDAKTNSLDGKVFRT